MTTNQSNVVFFGSSYAVDEIGVVTGEPLMEFAISVVEAGVAYRIVGTFYRKGRSLDFCYRLARRYMMLTRETVQRFGVFYTALEFPRYAGFNLWAERVGA